MARRGCQVRRATKTGKPSKKGDYMQRRCFSDNFGEVEWSKWGKPTKIRAKDKAKALASARKRWAPKHAA
jgi:hypothetical protein